ncbi:EutP/PduV family microcompartment system protein [Virgibacillus necropolis]|uniref:EutP/PduV family microcompartment system protein n=1 Tax=Virgibacillus necropolis TaxID=163877 RepID=UPI0029C6B3CB|nr:EutP/PduV family microcompartment system protein [Virgibacillus necropolis]
MQRKKKTIFPPGFSTGINKLPIGVVTKADAETADIPKAIHQLKRVISKGPIVITSAEENRGLDIIRDLVKCKSIKEMKEYAESCDSEDITFNETLYK